MPAHNIVELGADARRDRLEGPSRGFDSLRRDDLRAALVPYFAWYNFCRVYQSLRVAAAMEAGISDRVWTFESLFSA